MIETSYGFTIDFSPWEYYGVIPVSFHLFEKIGGELAHGEIELISNGSSEAKEAVDKLRTGTIIISSPSSDRTIQIFIDSINTSYNHVNMKIYCISSNSFYTKLYTNTWADTDIKSTIECLYPDVINIKNTSDIQNKLTFYQCDKTNKDMLTELCYSYKKNSVFSYGLEGLTLKDTISPSEPSYNVIGDTDFIQLGGYERKYDSKLYFPTLNIWEDTDLKKAIKDYTEFEPVNVRILKRGSEYLTMSTNYYQLHENSIFNKAYLNSKLFMDATIANYTILPEYRICDTIQYTRGSIIESKNLDWPYKNYLVSSNDLFVSLDGSDKVDSMNHRFSYTTVLLGLEENGEIAIGSEEDPTS